MVKPTAKSTVVQMRQYIRDNKLNKQPIRLGMKRAELITHLRKMGHWDGQHDKPSAKLPAPKAVPKPAPKRKVLKKAQEVGGEGSGVMPNPALPKDKAPAKDKASIRKQLKKDLGKLLTRNILSNTKNYPQFGTAMHIPPRPEDKYQFFGDRVTLKDVEPKIKAIKEALSKELLDQFRVQFISGAKSNDAELLYDFKTDTIIYTQDNKKKKARK